MTLPDTPSPDAHPVAVANTLQLHDARPFFEKALAYGVQHGVIGADKLAAINADAPKGMVQIARYFGSEFLRPELEKARDRMVNLISLYLLDTTGGDLHEAAISLRDHSLLSRSKGGSDMLKRLIAMPESSNFGMAGYADAETPLLAVWSLRSHADYRAELARRTQIAQAIHAAQWWPSSSTWTRTSSKLRVPMLNPSSAPACSCWPWRPGPWIWANGRTPSRSKKC